MCVRTLNTRTWVVHGRHDTGAVLEKIAYRMYGEKRFIAD